MSSTSSRGPSAPRAPRAPFRNDLLSVTKNLASPAIIRRGAVLAGLVVVERLLLPVATWAFFRHSLAQQITLALAASAVFSARTFLQHAFRARTEVNLLERVAGRLIGGDVLRVDVLRDEDARAELGQAMYHGAQNLSTVIPQVLADSLAAPVLAMVVIAREPPRLVALVVGMVIAIGAIMLSSRRSIERALATAWSAQIEAYGAFMDALEGRLEIVASGRRLPFLEEMQARCAAWGKAGARVAAGALVSGKLPLLAVGALAAGAIGLATVGGREALGITTADLALLASMTPAFSGVAQGIFALARSKRWMDVVASVLAEPPVGVGGQEAPPHAPATIAFEEVSFTYEAAAHPALSDLSFTWGREPILALTGENGSGKSTCLRLLLALATPQGGAIRIDGGRLDQLDADAWRGTVAFLPQRPYLPPRSDVRAAVHLIVPGAGDDAILQALDRVGLLAHLRRMGGDPLAARIGSLSVGQRQRVGLARLLCQPGSLVLLDEPDANLDRTGIAMLARLLLELAAEKKIALVAHHADLLEVADRIVSLDKGRLAGDEKRGIALPAARAVAPQNRSGGGLA